MKLEYSNHAQKNLAKLPRVKVKSILSKIELLRESPYLGKKLGGKFSGSRSMRVWPYRIIYQIDNWHKAIFIVTVEHRQGVYK